MTASDPAAPEGGTDIVVLDDFFPHPGSSFRYEEFISLLDALPRLGVYTSGTALHHADETRPIGEVVDEHLAAHPRHGCRVRALAGDAFPRARLYYAVFLHVIAEHVGAIEAAGGAFAFTLYPGGGFALDQPSSDALLRRVLGSRSFAHVIVTQAPIRRYLLDRGFCGEDQVTLIYGGVCPRQTLAAPPARTRYGFGKPTLDLCFVANRYTATGADKGYDLFVGAARQLAPRHPSLRFHVVGRFDASIIELGEAADVVTFYGLRPSAFFPGFYAGMDAIVSPTRAGVSYPGAFDGFPTGCSVEAGLNEVAVLCSDPLGLNDHYRCGDELVVVPTSVEGIVDAVESLARRPDRLARLGEAGRRRMLALFGHEGQVGARLAVLRRAMAPLDRVDAHRHSDGPRGGETEWCC